MLEKSYNYLLFSKTKVLKQWMSPQSESLNPVIFRHLLYVDLALPAAALGAYNISDHIVLPNYDPKEIDTLN